MSLSEVQNALKLAENLTHNYTSNKGQNHATYFGLFFSKNPA